MSKGGVELKTTIIGLLLIGVGARTLVWVFHGIDVFPSYDPSEIWRADCVAAFSDIMLLLSWDHGRPPLSIVLEILSCASWPHIHPTHLDLLIVSIVDVLATVAIYLLLCRLSIPRGAAAALAVIWTISLIAWEYYRFAGTHNHLNIACCVVLTYAAACRSSAFRPAMDITFAAVGALFIAMYGPAMIFVSITAFLTAPWRQGIRKAFRSLVIAISLPAVLIIGVGTKNYLGFGVFSTSSFLSLNLAQFGFIALGYDKQGEKLDQIVPSLKASDWWHWCYERVSSDTASVHPHLFGLQGNCLQFDDPASVREGLNAARGLDDQPFVQSLVQDLEMANKAPWAMRLSGLPMSSATEVVFNKTSKRLYGAVLKDDPLGMLRTFLMANRSFFIWGPLMFDGLHHEPQLVFAPRYINWLATGIGYGLILSVILGAVFLFRTMLKSASILIREGPSGLHDIPDATLFLSALFLAFLVTATIMNGVSCCENGRQFQSLSIVPFVIGVCLTRLLILKVRPRFSTEKGF